MIPYVDKGMIQTQSIRKIDPRSSNKGDYKDFVNLWLEWQVVSDATDKENLISLDFKLTKKEIKPTENSKVSVPIVALYHLAEKYNWLQVLRSPLHRPNDPYELVQFIQMLDRL